MVLKELTQSRRDLTQGYGYSTGRNKYVGNAR